MTGTNLREGTLGEDTIIEKDPVSVYEKAPSNQDGQMKSTYIKRQVLPQAPSPTMTSLRRISAILTREAQR